VKKVFAIFLLMIIAMFSTLSAAPAKLDSLFDNVCMFKSQWMSVVSLTDNEQSPNVFLTEVNDVLKIVIYEHDKNGQYSYWHSIAGSDGQFVMGNCPGETYTLREVLDDMLVL
jgi:hypothetical protein